MKTLMLGLMGAVLWASIASAQEPLRKTVAIFPPQEKHVHGSSLVELPNGDFLAAWFYGSGERRANDVVIQGARWSKGGEQWSPVFLMADTPNLPDCNPVLFLDEEERLWLFWIAVRANGWQHSVLRYKISENYPSEGPLQWSWQDIILLQPGESFAEAVREAFDILDPEEPMWAEYAPPYSRLLIESAQDKSKRQEGWMTRNHPIQLETGRILLPLYSDGYNFSLVAYSDDNGATWQASEPIVGLAGIQPTLIEKSDGSLVAFMRETGPPPYRIQKATSFDQGETWSVARDTQLPNPSSSMELLKLQSGNWALIYNDTTEDRDRIAVALSDDEGETWRWKRHLGEGEYYAYPSMAQAADGRIHISYTYRNEAGKTIRHEIINEAWVQEED